MGITDWVQPGDKSGEFKRQVSTFRDEISAAPGAKYPPEKGRYHLYVSLACPWAHRTLIVRALKGLEEYISVTTVHWKMSEEGWPFVGKKDKLDGVFVGSDPFHPDFTHVRQVYFESEPGYAGRFTVPVLYDTKTQRIVNNESADIIRMLDSVFGGLVPGKKTLVPQELAKAIDADNKWIYDLINNGVYKSGFATTQEAYERNVKALFAGLDRAEKHLSKPGSGPFWFGKDISETDVRLYTTMVRFDVVYVQHFKANLREVRSGYPALHRWLRTLYWKHAAFRDTTDFTHIKKHYTSSHPQINPLGITPLGPEPDMLPLDEEVPAVAAALNVAQ